MSAEKINEFISCLDSRTSSVQENILRLTADNRKDEADFEKIRANVFQIIKTMFQVSVRDSKNEDELITTMESKFASLKDPWTASLIKAKEYNDDIKVLKEQAKLEILSELQSTFQKIWG